MVRKIKKTKNFKGIKKKIDENLKRRRKLIPLIILLIKWA